MSLPSNVARSMTAFVKLTFLKLDVFAYTLLITVSLKSELSNTLSTINAPDKVMPFTETLSYLHSRKSNVLSDTAFA